MAHYLFRKGVHTCMVLPVLHKIKDNHTCTRLIRLTVLLEVGDTGDSFYMYNNYCFFLILILRRYKSQL